MPYLIGVDEAGYGPNLGPLVISATVWRVDADPRRVDLYARLKQGIVPSPDGQRICIADSKLLYKPAGGLAALERGVCAALQVASGAIPSWQTIWRLLGSDEPHAAGIPWYADYERPLPVHLAPEEFRSGCELLTRVLRSAKTELCAIRSVALFPERFNSLLTQQGTKGGVLSTATVGLLADVLASLPPEPVLAICDKHGGRNFYQQHLQMRFPERLVEVHRESRKESIYGWGPRERRIEVRFRTEGESWLPTALASMVSKYLRELAMMAFNDFWRRRVPGLRPTAGYPTDAKRFRREIASAWNALNVQEYVLWRER